MYTLNNWAGWGHMATMKRRALRLAVACGLLGTASSVFALDAVVGPGNCDEAGLTEVLGSGIVSIAFSGGAIQSALGPLLIEDSTFDSNTAHDSGAVFVGSQSSEARIERSVFTSNGADTLAGAISTSAAVTLVRGSRFEN